MTGTEALPAAALCAALMVIDRLCVAAGKAGDAARLRSILATPGLVPSIETVLRHAGRGAVERNTLVCAVLLLVHATRLPKGGMTFACALAHHSKDMGGALRAAAGCVDEGARVLALLAAERLEEAAHEHKAAHAGGSGGKSEQPGGAGAPGSSGRSSGGGNRPELTVCATCGAGAAAGGGKPRNCSGCHSVAYCSTAW